MAPEQSRMMPPDQPPGEPAVWAADDAGILPGGNVGGEGQAGESYSVRYRRADRPCAMITRTVYPVEADGQQGVFFVQIETEWLICTDPQNPGGTELWSDRTIDDEPGMYNSAAEAEKAAYQVAIRLLTDGGSQGWGGTATQ